jgi:phosphoserine phosphatase
MKYRLILSDVDSTLIAAEVIDRLAQVAGVGSEVAAITTRAMNGELDFEAALRQRVSMLAGLPETVFKEVARSIDFSPGAEELIAYCVENEIQFGVVSGGFLQVLGELGLIERSKFTRANTLEVTDGILTGRLIGEIVDRQAKAEALRDFAASANVALDQTVAIGDGANDIEMVQLAGLGVSFRGKPALAEVADVRLTSSLAELLPYL